MEKKKSYKRVLLKLSGSAFLGKQDFGINFEAMERIAKEIKEIYDLGIEIAIVVGGGNILRGATISQWGMDRAQADYMGMLATMINALALQDTLEKQGLDVRVQSAIDMRQISESYIRRKAIHHLEHGRIVIFAAGSGNPYMTTDTAASLRALEIKAQIILKGTRVEGVYSSDPLKDKKAKKYKEISFTEALNKKLGILDSTALSLCRDHNLPIVVFNLFSHGNIKKVVLGENIGTIVK